MIQRLEHDLEAACAAKQAAQEATAMGLAENLELKAEAATYVTLITTLRQSCAVAEQELRALSKGVAPSSMWLHITEAERAVDVLLAGHAKADVIDLSWFQGELPAVCQLQQKQHCTLEVRTRHPPLLVLRRMLIQV